MENVKMEGLYEGENLINLLNQLSGGAIVKSIESKVVSKIQKIEFFIRDLLKKDFQVGEEFLDSESLFSQMGLSSMDYMLFAGKIADKYQIKFSSGELYKYESIKELAKYLQSQEELDVTKESQISELVLEIGKDLGELRQLHKQEAQKYIAKYTKLGIGLWTGEGKLYARSIADTFTEVVKKELEEKKEILAAYIGDKKYFPMSMSQNRYLILSIMQDGKAAYNNPLGIKFQGTLDKKALEKAIGMMLKRHDILRSRFVEMENDFIAEIQPAKDSIYLEVIKVNGAQMAKKIMEKESQEPINPVEGPTFRVKLLQCSESEHILLITVHHTLFDGYTFGPFIKELFDNYQAICNNTFVEKANPVQYLDYVILEKLEFHSLEQEESYWKQKLQSAPTYTNLPLDQKRPEINSYEGDSEIAYLSSEDTETVKQYAKKAESSFFAVLLSSLKVMIAKWSGEHDLVFGTVVQNRDSVQYQEVLGDFTNFLPLRSFVEEDNTFLTYVKEENKLIQQALSNKAYPFEKMVDFAKRGPSNINPIYNIHVNALPKDKIYQVNDSLQATMLNNRLLNKSSMMDLRMEFNETYKGLCIVCEYNTDIFKRNTILTLLQNYKRMLMEAVTNPQIHIKELKWKQMLKTNVETVAVSSFKTSKQIVPTKRSLADTRRKVSKRSRGLQEFQLKVKEWYGEILEKPANTLDITRNFFEIGGNSLKAVKLVKRLEKENISMKVTDLFKYPTIQMMTEHLYQPCAEEAEEEMEESIVSAEDDVEVTQLEMLQKKVGVRIVKKEGKLTRHERIYLLMKHRKVRK